MLSKGCLTTESTQQRAACFSLRIKTCFGGTRQARVQFAIGLCVYLLTNVRLARRGSRHSQLPYPPLTTPHWLTLRMDRKLVSIPSAFPMVRFLKRKLGIMSRAEVTANSSAFILPRQTDKSNTKSPPACTQVDAIG